MNRSRMIMSLAVLLAAITATGSTQELGGPITYDLSWYSIDSGGGESAGGGYILTYSIGQSDAGVSSGGGYTFTGGFLAIAGGAPCPADFTSSGGGGPDGQVGIDEFLAVLADWGCTGSCAADISGPADVPDGLVGIADFLSVLANWGACP